MKIFIWKPRNVLFFKGRRGRGDKIFAAENEDFGEIIQSEGGGRVEKLDDTSPHTSELETKKIKIQFTDHLMIT